MPPALDLTYPLALLFTVFAGRNSRHLQVARRAQFPRRKLFSGHRHIPQVFGIGGTNMKREAAVRKVEQAVHAVCEGKVPYRVLQFVLYGSTAKGAENPNDVDLYVQLDPASVPEVDIVSEIFYPSGGIGTKLRRALKEKPHDRVIIQWGFEPWEEYRLKFVKPEEVDQNLHGMVGGLDLDLASHRRVKGAWERSVAKRRARPTEWPPLGVVLFDGEPHLERMLSGARDNAGPG